VTFDVPVIAESARDEYNYSIAGLEISEATILNPRTVVLSTSLQTPGAVYTLIVNGIRNFSDPTCGRDVIFANSRIDFTALAARLEIQRSAGLVTVSWSAEALLAGYFLAVSASLSPPDWKRVAPWEIDGHGRAFVQFAVEDGNRFYRLRKE
jgi:hypothetical protein